MFTVTQQVGRAAWWESASVSVLSRSALSSESVVLALPFFTSVFTPCVSPVTGWPPRRVGLSFCPHGAPSVGRSQISTQGSQRGAGMRCKQERPLLSHAGWDGFSWMMGTAWAGLRGRAIVTCRSVILLPVTGSLLYTIKGLYSLRPLKSRVQGRLQEWLDWGIQHCLPGPIQLSPLLMSWQDVQYDPGLVTKGQTGQSKRTKIRSFTLDELSYLSIPGPVTGRGWGGNPLPAKFNQSLSLRTSGFI